MLQCPKCGNTEKFIVDVQGYAKYNQSTDSFEKVENFEFLHEGCHVVCYACRHQAEIEEFEHEGE